MLRAVVVYNPPEGANRLYCPPNWLPPLSPPYPSLPSPYRRGVVVEEHDIDLGTELQDATVVGEAVKDKPEPKVQGEREGVTSVIVVLQWGNLSLLWTPVISLYN